MAELLNGFMYVTLMKYDLFFLIRIFIIDIDILSYIIGKTVTIITGPRRFV